MGIRINPDLNADMLAGLARDYQLVSYADFITRRTINLRALNRQSSLEQDLRHPPWCQTAGLCQPLKVSSFPLI